MTARTWIVIVSVTLVSALAAAQVATDKAPDTGQQGDMLNKMSEYAESYISNLPNFLCTQETTHFESGLKHLHWTKVDTVVAQLSYSEGQEHRKIQLINNKAPKVAPRSWRWKLSTEGEFSADLGNVFAEESKAGFAWNRWDTLRSSPVAVFDYTIQKEHSRMTLTMMGVSAVVGYRGTIWADAATGQVWRIENRALDIPPELQMQEISKTVDYAPVQIVDRTYILPVHAETIEKNAHNNEKNDIDFRDYQQFRADSTLRFDVPDEPKK